MGFWGGISSHLGHPLRHHPRVFVGAVPRSAWPRRVVQHWSLGACMRRPEKKGRQVAGFVGRAFIVYLYLVPMKRYVGSMYDAIYFALQGTNISPFESMNFRLSAGGICDRLLESTWNSNLNHQKVIPKAWLIWQGPHFACREGDLGIDSDDLETSRVLNTLVKTIFTG